MDFYPETNIPMVLFNFTTIFFKIFFFLFEFYLLCLKLFKNKNKDILFKIYPSLGEEIIGFC